MIKLKKKKKEFIKNKVKLVDIPCREIIIRDDTVEWRGFNSSFELLGFIEARVKCDLIKQLILNALNKQK